MKKIVLKFGLLSGLVISGIGAILTPIFCMRGNFENSQVVGYSAMVLAFLFVFFGIRAYRENNGGAITFGKAFQVGILITLITCTFYVVSWEIVYFNFMP